MFKYLGIIQATEKLKPSKCNIVHSRRFLLCRLFCLQISLNYKPQLWSNESDYFHSFRHLYCMSFNFQLSPLTIYPRKKKTLIISRSSCLGYQDVHTNVVMYIMNFEKIQNLVKLIWIIFLYLRYIGNIYTHLIFLLCFMPYLYYNNLIYL